MTRTDVEILASIAAIVLAWILLFGIVTTVEDCLGVDDHEPVPLFVRGER